MRTKPSRAVAVLLCLLSSGCVLSITSRLALSRSPTGTPTGVVVYPSLWLAGKILTAWPPNPALDLLVAVDLPLSLLFDTLALPTDLTHQDELHGPRLPLDRPATRPTTGPAAETGRHS